MYFTVSFQPMPSNKAFVVSHPVCLSVIVCIGGHNVIQLVGIQDVKHA